MRTLLKWLGMALCVVVVGMLLIVFDWSWLKGPIEDYVREQTGRTLTIGELRGDVSLTPHLYAQAVTFANADWSDEPYMAQLRRLEIRVDVLKLLQGKLVMPELTLTDPVLRLQKSIQGSSNWGFLNSRAPDTMGSSRPLKKNEPQNSGRIPYRPV